MIHVGRGKAVFWLGVAWSVGVWSVLLTNVIRNRIGDTPARSQPISLRRDITMPNARHRLKADAGNRSLRTFLQGLAFTVLTAIVLVLYPVVSSAHSWGDVHWSLLGFALAQAIGTAVLAYVMRAKLDASGFPTPLPPSDPGEPDADAGA